MPSSSENEFSGVLFGSQFLVYSQKVRKSEVLCCRRIVDLLLKISFLTCLVIDSSNALVVPLSAANPAVSLAGVMVPKVFSVTKDEEKNIEKHEAMVDLGATLSAAATASSASSEEPKKKRMIVFGTHAADFNTIEYLQKIMFYRKSLFDKGVERCMVVINGTPEQCRKLAELLDLEIGRNSNDNSGDGNSAGAISMDMEIELFSDPTGEAGRNFGVSRGFRPDDENLPPFAKQFFSGIGIGPPWMTLPAVLPGYFGNPNGNNDWIVASLKQGQLAGRWPSVLDLEIANETSNAGERVSHKIAKINNNKFDQTPLLASWGVRPFELATLRLQNLIGIQMKHWDALKPVDDRCLTQHGGCAIVQSSEQGNCETLYSWVDRGLCDVPDMLQVMHSIE